MQDDREKRVRLSGPADMDDAGVLKFIGQDVYDQCEHVVIERTQRAVDEHPGRRLYHHARKRQTELLVLTQFPVPPVSLIEQWRETFEAEPVERTREGAGAEAFGLQRIGENLSQSSTRQIRSAARQVKYLFAPRAGDVPCTPGPQAGQRSKQLSLTGSRRAQNEGAFSGSHDHIPFLEHVGVGGGHDFEVVDRYRTGLAFGVVDAAFKATGLIGGDQCMTKNGDSKQCRAPVGDDAEIVYEPAERRLRLGERTGRHHETAERNLSREIKG